MRAVMAVDRTAGLLLSAVALFLITFTVSTIAQPAPSAHVSAIPPTTASDYLGSKACATCHQEAYDQWSRSQHLKMTQPIADATVLGDFRDGTTFAAHGRTFEFGRTNGQPFFRVGFAAARPETFNVDYTLGSKRYQGYLSKLPDGGIYVLPAFWHIETQRWIDWKEITPIPDGAHDLRQIWNTNCFNCHATNLVRGFDIAAKAHKTTWTEMGIGCEACHGPGRPHVAVIEASRKDPSLKPGGTLDTFSPRNGSPRQTFDMCAYCHGNKQNVFVGFRGGDRYEDYALPFLISAPIPDTDVQGEFWPDGRPNRFNRSQALTLSGCFKAGEIACSSCHVAHGSPNPYSLKFDIEQGRNGDLLCTQCHGPAPQGVPAPALGSRLRAEGTNRAATRSPQAFSDAEIERHTFHPAASSGSRCIGCHMSEVNWRLLIRRRDHTFLPPVPETTAAFGVPNPCTACHDNRTPEWAATQMDRWWGDGARRKASLSVADTMYRAGSGDATVLPSLARLAVDRTQGALIRASAVEFITQLVLGAAGGANANAPSQTSFAAVAPKHMSPAAPPPLTLTNGQVNALIGAAADPEPMVRAHAINALVATGDRPRIITPILARLIDPARVVRARAAEALLTLGISQLPGNAGEALTRAQDDYAAALSAFPDAASNYTALGWLEMERGRPAQADEALQTAMRLDPRAARPLVIKGLVAARAGRFGEAIDLWRKARGLEPNYPRVDDLIREAEQRK